MQRLGEQRASAQSVQDQLLAYKKKTEDALIAQREALLKDRQVTKERLADLTECNDAKESAFAQEQEAALLSFRAKGVVSKQNVKRLRGALADLRSRQFALQSEFTKSVSQFMREFRTTKQIMQRACGVYQETRVTDTVEDVQTRIDDLQRQIAMKYVHQQSARTLQVCHGGDMDVMPKPKARMVAYGTQTSAPRQQLQPSDFLTAWFIEFEGLLRS
jgi:hypothetical protein